MKKLFFATSIIIGTFLACQSGGNTPSADSASITLEDKPTVTVDSSVIKKDSLVLDTKKKY